MFSFGLDPSDVKRVVWTFAQAFVITFWATAQGWSALPNYADGKALVIASLIAGGAAVISLVKNLFLGEGHPLK